MAAAHISRFISGPAAAVIAISLLGFLNFLMSTGTGFAQPKWKSTIMARPMRSMCFSGLSVSRPMRLAVSSPSLWAAQPWRTRAR